MFEWLGLGLGLGLGLEKVVYGVQRVRKLLIAALNIDSLYSTSVFIILILYCNQVDLYIYVWEP